MGTNYGFISPFTMDSFRWPVTSPYVPFVKPDAAFPTLPVWTSDFQAGNLNNAPATDYYKMGKDWMADMNASTALSSSAQGLSALEGEITKTMESDALSEEQKQRLQEILDKIETLKEQVKNAADKSADEKNALVQEIAQLQEEAANIAKQISEEIQQNASNEAGGAENNNGSDASATTVPENVDAPVAQELTKEQENEALEICQSIYQGAIGVTGTNYDYITDGYNGMKGTNAITKDNVTAVLNKWQEQFAKGSGDDNVIETLFDEEMFWNPSLKERGANGKISDPEHNVDIIWNILKCLEERAKELGVYNSLVGQFSIAYDELDDFNIDQSAVEDAIMTINQTVTVAENQKKTEKAEEKAKADKEKAAKDEELKAEEEKQKVETEAKDTFLGDMREIWGDDKLEISDKVKYKDGRFVIRIEGIEYSGKDFNELCKNVSDAGHDPQLFLIKKHLDRAA